MADTDQVAQPELARWIVVAVVIVVGITLFFLYAPDTPPAVVPSTEITR